MKKLSEVSVLAWNIAGAEAISAGFDTIEREHLFVSLTEIEKLLSLTAAKLNFDETQIQCALDEYAEILRIFEKLRLDPRKLRRNVRLALGEGKTGDDSNDIRRSRECKEIFQQAEMMSGVKETVNGLDLMAALMGNPGKIISDALGHYGVEPSRMLSAVNDARLGKRAGGPDREYMPKEDPAPAPVPAKPGDEKYMPQSARMAAEAANHAPPIQTERNPARKERFQPPSAAAAPEPDNSFSLLKKDTERLDNSPYAPPIRPRQQVQQEPPAALPANLVRGGAAGHSGSYTPPKHGDKLLRIGKNLLKRASEKLLFPAVQREKEIKTVFDILNRRAKMPLLIGEEGVGKSTVIHSLALRVWDNTAPETMKGAHIIEFTRDEVMSAGGSNPVEFFRGVLEEAEKHPSVYLYISDLHNFLSRGDAISVMLKEFVMERGVHVIGGTTAKGYKEDVEPENKFVMYFESVEIREPEQAAALEILRASKTRLEIKSGGRITDRALQAAYTLSTRLKLPGVMPKKALNLIRASCDRARAGATPELAEKFVSVSKKFGLEPEPGVNELWVCQTAAEQAGSRLETAAAELSGRSPVRMENLGRNIKGGIVGQNEAVEMVTARISQSSSFAGNKTAKPLLFYFVGPKGVGKTELARHMAIALFGSEEDMYVFDMSQYGREESLRRIFGNREIEGRLELAVRESPFGLVLFENADKTLPMFYNLLASFLEEAGSRGIELKNTVFVICGGLTLAPEKISKYPTDKEIVKSVADRIPTGIQHHISDIVPFKPLNIQSANLILLRWIDEVRTTMQKEYGVYIQMGRDVERALVRTGLSVESGARRLRMVFDQIIMQPLQRIIDTGIVSQTKQWVFLLSDDHVVLMPKSDADKTTRKA